MLNAPFSSDNSNRRSGLKSGQMQAEISEDDSSPPRRENPEPVKQPPRSSDSADTFWSWAMPGGFGGFGHGR